VNSLKQIIKKINWLRVSELLLVTILVLSPLWFAHAQLPNNIGCQPGQNCTGGDINSFIKVIINWLLGIAFGVAVLFLIIGGFWYITSAGNEETAEKGKNTAINAIIGIVIIVLSYVIVNVVSTLVSKGSSSGTGG
jgi:heme/copper-type cytochrome/quinol oxidase subunit 2